MNSVRPLGYLLGKTIVNGVKRAVTSPKRIIGLAFFALYYWNLFLRPFEHDRPTRLPANLPHFDLPPVATIDAGVFGLVGVMSLLLMGSVLGYKGGFKASDVDVLFPTPVSPKVVLLFRIARDTLATLLLPLVLAIIGFRGGSTVLAPLFRDYPRQGGDILRAAFLAYLMVAFVWVCVGYAASLFVNRSDLDSDRNRKRIGWGVGVLIAAAAIFIAVRLRADLSFANLIDIAHSPFIRIALAPVTLATWVVMGVFEGHWATALGGFVGLALLVALALRVALTQVGWMYDQAAVRGFDSGPNMRDLQRRGDTMAMQAERARQGKLKHGRIARRISNLRVRGPVALLWKEAILQARGSLSGLIFLGAIFLAMTGLAVWTLNNAETLGRRHAPPASLSGWVVLGMQGLVVYVLCMASANGGFIEFLRRVDVQKPLPFTPAVTVFWETAAKAVAPTILGALVGIVGVVMAPAVWAHALAGTILLPSLALLITAVVLLVVVIFPDIEDPTQRAFRGLMMLLGLALCVTPGGGLFVVAVWNGLSPLLAAPVALAINLAIAIGLSALSGGLYANYNPNE